MSIGYLSLTVSSRAPLYVWNRQALIDVYEWLKDLTRKRVGGSDRRRNVL
jgi:hypothetical protein